MFRSIRGKLLVSHLSIFLVLMFMGLAGIFLLSSQQEKNSMARLQMISDHTAKMVGKDLFFVGDMLKTICESQVVTRFADSFQVPALAKYFAEQHSTFSELSFIDSGGYEELRIVMGVESDGNREMKDNPFFLKSKELPGETFIDHTIDIDETGIHIHFIRGLKRYFGDQFVGSVYARYDLGMFSQTLSMMEVGKGGLIILVDEVGRMIASPGGFATGGEIFALAPDRDRILDDIKAGRKFSFRGEVAGQDCFLVSSPIENAPWVVITAQPYDIFMEEIKRFKGLYMLLLAATGCLGWVLVYILADRLTFPILSLRDQVSKITRGVADTIDLESRDEVGELVRSFNEMLVELRETSVSRDFLDKVINSMNDILVVIGRDGRVERANLHAREVLGYSLKEVLALHLQDFLKGYANEEQPWYEAFPWLLFDKPVETELFAKDGLLIPVLVTSSPFLDEKGAVNGAVIVAHDISDRKEAEEKLALYAEQLQASNKELEEFAYVASHDLKEPLRKITSFGERLNLKFGDKLGEQGSDYLARMDSAAARMQRLIDDLLTYSRVKTKARPFEPVDLNRIAAEVLSDLEASISDRKGKVTVSELATISADQTQMRQLFQNLIGNGLKFHKDDVPPVIEVSGEMLESGYYQLVFKDNGIGIDEKYSDKIFGVFQRLHGRKEYEGSGIGLSVCRKIAIRHGGDITISSKVDEGSKFIVTLDPEMKNDEPVEGGRNGQ
ncbi:MAG: PAS domain S-box protein [Proteobacteria bacterium]|nr:PAS domain S-box protein [Pseudomonadota bacterium]MBU1739255.1 PAS domain S-box protein [Pseudomonadota bacterium]